MMSSSSGSWGSERKRSVTHMSAASTLPRALPAMAPTITPTTTAISIAVSPTAIERRPPYSIRARRSCPRSSVPKGCAAEGPCERGLKSISLMGTGHSHGLASTAVTITTRMIAPRNASRWRRKRRHASAPGRARGRAGAPAAAPSTVNDAGVEPAIHDVGEQVEEDHETGEHERHGHDDGGVVRQDRAHEQRSDARHAKDLLGHDRPAEDGGHRQRHQRHDGDEGVAQGVLDDDPALGEPLRARGSNV